MASQLAVHFLPELTSQQELAGGCVVMIDVLRASTTICFALAAGAKEVIPCLHIDDARELKRGFGDAGLTGGERKGLKIDGFDLGNSPREYLPEVVDGKTILFTTTNGAKALHACVGSHKILVGGFVNLSLIVEAIRGEPNVHLLCAGTDGAVTREDVLLAGVLAEQLYLDQLSLCLNDSAQLAIDAWQGATGGDRDPKRIHRCLQSSQGGRNLKAIGQESDIRVAAAVDMVPVVPVLDRASWRIRLA
ncbi:MAG: 2-phosphosulfolactate phosphatase [Planctomycetales bacterium]|nr:2-phosphosulfolactate phosphatase [Planctomycetales bacterium]